MTNLLASKALDILELFSILLWDALHLLLGVETNSALVNFLVRAYGGNMTLFMTIKTLHILRVSCIVSCLAILPLLVGSEANSSLVVHHLLLA